MYYDPSGHLPWLFIAVVATVLLFTPIGGTTLQVIISTLSYVGMAIAAIFDEDIRNDMNAIKWNPFNKDESVVSNSNKVSFYKGVPVFKTSGSSGSFLGILLTKNGFKGTSGHYWSPEDILKHEWGHSIQQMIYGPIPYLINIGIPSAFIDNSDDVPWEITADLFGGVNRNYNFNDVKRGWNYFWWRRLLIKPFGWW